MVIGLSDMSLQTRHVSNHWVLLVWCTLSWIGVEGIICPGGQYASGGSCYPCGANLNSPPGSTVCLASYPLYMLVGEASSTALASKIRKVDLSTSAVSTLTTQGFPVIRAVQLSKLNDFALFIADQTLYKLDLLSSAVTTVVVMSQYPHYIAISSDSVYALVSVASSHSIFKVILSTGTSTRIAGTLSYTYSEGAGTSIGFQGVGSVVMSLDDTFALVAETSGHRIRRLDLTVDPVTSSLFAGSVQGTAESVDGIGTNAKFNSPTSMTFSPDNTIAVIAEHGGARSVRILVLATKSVTSIPIAFGSNVMQIQFSSLSSLVYCTVASTNKIYSMNLTSKILSIA
jgi:hypothetical protein